MRQLSGRPAVFLGLLLLLGVGLPTSARGQAATPEWEETRKALFQDRPIQESAGDVILLDVATQPDDAAAVPVLIKVKQAQSREHYVKAIFVVIDKNPEPLAGVFYLTPESGLAEVQTRLRVETHSPMRAIAEMNDGKLFMFTKLVRAAGGCAAPPVMITAPPNLGEIKIRTQEKLTPNEPNWAQLIVVHPNHTGFQRHPLTLLPISADFVTDITVTFAGRPILTAKTTIAMSEDPDFRFYYAPSGGGVLKAEVRDSRGRVSTKSLEVVPN